MSKYTFVVEFEDGKEPESDLVQKSSAGSYAWSRSKTFENTSLKRKRLTP